MADEPISIPLKYKAGAKVIMMVPKGMVTPTGAMVNCTLHSVDGKIKIELPPQMFPGVFQPDIPIGVVLGVFVATIDVPEQAPQSLIMLK